MSASWFDYGVMCSSIMRFDSSNLFDLRFYLILMIDIN